MIKNYFLLIVPILILIGLTAHVVITKVSPEGEKNSLARFDPFLPNPQRFNQFTVKGNRKYILQPPINYDETIQYPLVIGLHGWTKSRDAYFTPAIVGNKEQWLKYSCFYFAPNNNDQGWGNKAEWARILVKKIVENYSIDESRIYIVGFSMGGSGAYLFADALYEEGKFIPAAIIRIAGRSQTTLITPLESKTAVWYHVGSEDSEDIIEIAHSAYSIRKTNSMPHTETVWDDTAGIFKRKTFTLSNFTPPFLLSIYEGMGHEYKAIFASDEVIDWLFEQQIISE